VVLPPPLLPANFLQHTLKIPGAPSLNEKISPTRILSLPLPPQLFGRLPLFPSLPCGTFELFFPVPTVFVEPFFSLGDFPPPDEFTVCHLTFPTADWSPSAFSLETVFSNFLASPRSRILMLFNRPEICRPFFSKRLSPSRARRGFDLPVFGINRPQMDVFLLQLFLSRTRSDLRRRF